MPSIYEDNSYIEANPTWHEEDSPWKASHIMRILEANEVAVKSVAEIGCGFGGILGSLYKCMPDDVEFDGYDIAPQAIAHAKANEDARLHFHQEDLLKNNKTFDLLLAIDVIEHVPDLYGFLEGCRRKASYKVYHIPLAIHVSSVVRASLAEAQAKVGHIHYFSSETALAALKYTGHEIVDSSYTDGSLALKHLHPAFKTALANVPRTIVSAFSTKWSARLLGGYSLLVLCK